MFIATTTRRSAGRIAAAAAVACVLLAPSAGAQIATVRLDPDAAQERFLTWSGDLGGRIEKRSHQRIAVERVAMSRLDTSLLRPQTGFLKGHLLPRMSRQVAGVSSIHALETQRGWFEDSSMHDWVAQTVGHHALRATRKAAKAYLYEVTTLGVWLESRPVGGRSRGPQRGASVKLDVSHGIPKVGLRHVAAVGSTRFDVGADGSMRLEFRPTSSPSARLFAGYAAADSLFILSYRVGF